MKTISIIAAVAQNNALGYKNQLLYHLPDDLKRFKKLTSGHTVIMGKNTYDSLPNGALPNRRNIVLSRSVKELPDCDVYTNIDEALKSCGDEEIFIIGGASIYKQMIDKADRIYITEVYDVPENADVFFPEIPEEFDVEYGTVHEADEKHKYPFAFVNYVKK